MSPAQSHSLNETAIPVPENIFGQIAHADPVDAIEIAKKLPLDNRARLAAFCYERRHLNHLGLLIASTCDWMTLRRAMGTAGDVVYKQSRDVETTLAAARGGRTDASKITLATAANVLPLNRLMTVDLDPDDNGDIES